MGGLTSNTAGILHEKLVFNRRVEVLANWFAELIPKTAQVLDVGCGDGLVSAVLQSKRPDVSVRGMDVLPRSQSHIPVEMFDGSRLPCADSSFDGVLFSDVLHHTTDPLVLLREARRVARQFVLIKDHNRSGLAAGVRLRFMDWVGNSRFGVSLPYNYWTKRQWSEAWRGVGLKPAAIVDRLGLYPPPANWVFGAGLHFVARLEKCAPISDGARVDGRGSVA
jgi:SAM-dependent methyltransferase